MARALHPVAWWGWAIGMAVTAGLTTNPVLLALLLGVVTWVVLARRGDWPWARAFGLYAVFGLVIIVMRLVFHVLVGFKYGTVLLLPLPVVPLPSWAAGIDLLGPVYLEGLLGAALQGLRLAAIIMAIGAANALANPKRLLRSFPRALHEIGTAVVVAVSVAPQLAASVQRVLRARRLRGESGGGIRSLPRVAIPVLQDTLDRSLVLAGAMESRGYGSHTHGPTPWWVPVLTLGGLTTTCWGLYALLAPGSLPPALGPLLLLLGAAASLAGLGLAGRRIAVTRYRPDPWRTAETLTVISGLACAGLVIAAGRLAPLAMDMPLQPLAAPVLPLLALVGILVGGLPALVTPPTPRRATAARPAPRKEPAGV